MLLFAAQLSRTLGRRVFLAAPKGFGQGGLVAPVLSSLRGPLIDDFESCSRLNRNGLLFQFFHVSADAIPSTCNFVTTGAVHLLARGVDSLKHRLS
jgi:hypothetical protein